MARKYQAYPEYKESDVEWLGDLPIAWQFSRFKHQVDLVTDKATSKTNPVALENIKGWTGEFVPSEAGYQGEGVSFRVGDILFGKLRPYLAKVARQQNLW